MSELTREKKLERLLKVDFYLDKIPDEKQEGILLGLSMVAALYETNIIPTEKEINTL